MHDSERAKFKKVETGNESVELDKTSNSDKANEIEIETNLKKYNFAKRRAKFTTRKVKTKDSKRKHRTNQEQYLGTPENRARHNNGIFGKNV